MAKTRRLYCPLTSQKRFKGKRNPSLKARKTLEETISRLIQKAKDCFAEMSDQSFFFDRSKIGESIPLKTYERLSASRVFYLFKDPQNYKKSAFTPFKLQNHFVENFVKDFLAQNHLLVNFQPTLYHPILFFLNCQPDFLIIKNKQLILGEVKGLYVRNAEVLTEFGIIHNPERDFKTWISQVQFSLALSGIKRGRLIVVKESEYEIVHDEEIELDPNFLERNLTLFTDFFLTDLIFQNSGFRGMAPGIHRRLKLKFRRLFDDQVSSNKTLLMERFGEAGFLEKHFDKIHGKIIQMSRNQ